jgi:hypothetical protein
VIPSTIAGGSKEISDSLEIGEGFIVRFNRESKIAKSQLVILSE